ncbi:uncharacterized protein LACBIDRAFT_324667 [Laccaria bicolor S238N-H82]|uniref:Predicted protein n=1 Tax=Laccaria bicolor (strain S238N-H82 / ATCC MYA-4686) TaxID=486041 RepID=B0D2N2_LACBS|nr:uncharacterized protein LACBIDRAFT_324667 [Laccaria bicolor S238N-H82]EDR10781.1 predicted protein [Laccaria bicolor S238N-H82]|eukprot:XP_001878082.1 predicted protein [Laccaria bicolor S238N-H82]
MNELNDLLQLLKDTPGHSVTLVKIFHFVTYAISLKDDILLLQPSSHPPSVAPMILPQAVKQFLATACNIPPDITDDCWTILRTTIWNDGGDFTQCDMQSIFLRLGIPWGYYPAQYTLRPRYVRMKTACTQGRFGQSTSIVKNGIRHYYSSIPDILQVAEHQFVKKKLVNLWLTLMVVSWTSATNCACFYNVALHGDHQSLSVPHGGLDKDRYKLAMQPQSIRMQLYSQPELWHYCSEKTCTIIGCSEKVASNKRTCLVAEHQAVEKVHNKQGQAQFQLQERLKQACVAYPSDLIGESVNDVSQLADVESDEEFELANGKVLPSQASHTSSDPTRKRKNRLCAQFGQKRTHNEQVIVAPCGMIITHETFFGAEAVSSVVEMVKRTYHIPGTMPDHIFFDNNCQLAKIVQGDPAFRNVGLSVDVFHFKSKHSITDMFCQMMCNPASFPELKGEGDKLWYFNSSIAEQTNGDAHG